MASRTRRRRYSFVDRSLQYRFIAIILVYSMTIVFFLALCLFVPDIIDMTNEDMSMEVREAAAQRILGLHTRVWPAIVILVFLIILHSIGIFHRFVGPLYRFRWAFSNISRGDMGFRVKLRKKDYLHREEATFNEMMDVLSEKWGIMRMAATVALRSLGALEGKVTKLNDWQGAEQQLLQTHRKHLEALAEHAQYFQLKEEEKLEQHDVRPPA